MTNTAQNVVEPGSQASGVIAAKRSLLAKFVCPQCKAPFLPECAELIPNGSGSLNCPAGHSTPVVRGIPRFVESDLYVDSFSFEWNTHTQTQLDSVNQASSSTEMFTQKTGLRPEDVAGKLVLDAGVGAGRFCDVLSSWGANVIGVDLSFAVEASHRNFIDRPNVCIAQADIGSLPFPPETFDYIVSIGVLHHTPDTKTYFNRLVPLVKRGGSIAIWVYPNEGDYAIRNEWIPFTYRIPDRMFYQWCSWIVPLFQRNRKSSLLGWLRRLFPMSDQGLGVENDILDTFDGFSPRFHGIHSPAEVEGWFTEAGLTGIHQPSSWHTSVRGQKP